MFVTRNIRNQIVARFFCRSLGTEKVRAHIVIDPDHTSALAGETSDRFRADWSGRACNNDRAHQIATAWAVTRQSSMSLLLLKDLLARRATRGHHLRRAGLMQDFSPRLPGTICAVRD